MPATRAKTESITESILFEQAMVPDRENGILRGVKILGSKSKNGRTYKESAMRKAIGLYEGAKVNFNHPIKPGQSREYGERFGKVVNVQFRDNGLYGDLKFNPKHPLAEQFCWDAEHSPDSCGLSHNVKARTTGKHGSLVVEDISEVTAVDVVADPGSTNGLFEHEEAGMTLSEFLESYKGVSVRGMSLLEAFGQMPNMPAAPMQGVAPMAAGMEGPQVNQQLKAALKAALNALMDDDSISLDEVLDLIKEKAGSAPLDPTEEPEMTDDEKKAADDKQKKVVEEAIQTALKPLTESLASTTKELDARKVLESKGATPNPQLLGELLECADKPAMEKLVEGWGPMKLGKNKPTIQRLNESKSVGEYPKDNESFVRALKR